ncbi:MAG: 16S rRNA (guanine(527)-N(7))-methyltransferase RsmG [Desulfuromonadales bacterium]|nr:16S rRNA (guanine(527)-N(7))-methyltransferase RsmG [Desulfuromonadales bacterium]
MAEFDRLAFLADGLRALNLRVPPGALPQLLWFLDELMRWNRRSNLTAITDPREAIEKHLLDSLTPLPLLPAAPRLLDLGSGGGFPGIPLQLARPELRLVSVDAVGKKIAFQRHALRALGLSQAEALHERAEALPARPGFQAGFDLIVSRAFASLTDFSRHALPCLAPRGFLLAMKGPEGGRELAESRPQLAAVGLESTDLHRLRLPVSRAERTLIVLRRVQ